jgi:DNA-binding GntR family transcriptional regulator
MIDTGRTNTPSRVDRIADTLRHDIRRRSLAPGDRYYTASEAARAFGVSPMSANRAMNVLAEQNLLVRHRSRGTFVGPNWSRQRTRPSTLCVHYVHFSDFASATRLWPTDEMLRGIQQSLPGARLKLVAIPIDDALVQFRQELADIESAAGETAIILGSAPRVVQEAAADSGVPTVIDGSAYPHVKLSFLEEDQAEIARLQIESVARRGCDRIVLLSHERWRYGDSVAFNRYLQAATASGYAAGDIRVCNLPEETLAAEILCETALKESIDGPAHRLGLVCRGARIAELVSGVAERLGEHRGESIEIVYGSRYQPTLFCPCVVPEWTLAEQFAALGTLLDAAIRGTEEVRTAFIPVTLVESG